MASIHAKSRPPSSAERWLSCPASVTVAPLYPNDPSVHSDKGDLAHRLLEDNILFGIQADTQDPDMDMNIRDVMDWIKDRVAEYGECQVFAEQRYDIPETGEFGTCDITILSDSAIHLADYKNGFVATSAFDQMMCYLLGAIAKYGIRDNYKITVLQPNYNHRDGPYRTTEINKENINEFRNKVLQSIEQNKFVAGPHCKKTYCPHRGSCETFITYCETEAIDAWFPHEVNAMDDLKLSQVLDHADTLHGIRDAYRKEAMIRIAQHDRTIKGYKLVKSRQQRDFAGEEGRGACYKALIDIGYSPNDLYEKTDRIIDGVTFTETALPTVAGVERLVKQKFKSFKRGTWKNIWDEHFRPHIREFSGSLTLERDIDGRPAHTRGSEFGNIATASQVGQVI